MALIPADADGPAERAERREAIARSREALQALKPQELRALTLLAEGYSYARDRRDHRLQPDENQPLPGRGRERFRQLPRRAARTAAAAPRCGRCSPPSAMARPSARGGGGAARAPARLRPLPGDPARLPGGARRAAAALAPALPLGRSLLDRAHDAFAGAGGALRRRRRRHRLGARAGRRGRRHARRRDGGAGEGRGDLRRHRRRRRGLRRDRRRARRRWSSATTRSRRRRSSARLEPVARGRVERRKRRSTYEHGAAAPARPARAPAAPRAGAGGRAGLEPASRSRQRRRRIHAAAAAGRVPNPRSATRARRAARQPGGRVRAVRRARQRSPHAGAGDSLVASLAIADGRRRRTRRPSCAPVDLRVVDGDGQLARRRTTSGSTGIARRREQAPDRGRRLPRARRRRDAWCRGDAICPGDTTRSINVHIPLRRPGRYTAEVWLEGARRRARAAGERGAALRRRPARPGAAAGPGRLGRAASAAPCVQIEHPAGAAAGLRHPRLRGLGRPRRRRARPARAPDRCSQAETDLRGGIGDDTISLGAAAGGRQRRPRRRRLRLRDALARGRERDRARRRDPARGRPRRRAGGLGERPGSGDARARRDALSGMAAAGPTGRSPRSPSTAACRPSRPGDAAARDRQRARASTRVAFYARDAAGNVRGEDALAGPDRVVRIDETPAARRLRAAPGPGRTGADRSDRRRRALRARPGAGLDRGPAGRTRASRSSRCRPTVSGGQAARPLGLRLLPARRPTSSGPPATTRPATPASSDRRAQRHPRWC